MTREVVALGRLDRLATLTIHQYSGAVSTSKEVVAHSFLECLTFWGIRLGLGMWLRILLGLPQHHERFVLPPLFPSQSKCSYRMSYQQRSGIVPFALFSIHHDKPE